MVRKSGTFLRLLFVSNLRKVPFFFTSSLWLGGMHNMGSKLGMTKQYYTYARGVGLVCRQYGEKIWDLPKIALCDQTWDTNTYSRRPPRSKDLMVKISGKKL